MKRLFFVDYELKNPCKYLNDNKLFYRYFLNIPLNHRDIKQLTYDYKDLPKYYFFSSGMSHPSAYRSANYKFDRIVLIIDMLLIIVLICMSIVLKPELLDLFGCFKMKNECFTEGDTKSDRI